MRRQVPYDLLGDVGREVVGQLPDDLGARAVLRGRPQQGRVPRCLALTRGSVPAMLARPAGFFSCTGRLALWSGSSDVATRNPVARRRATVFAPFADSDGPPEHMMINLRVEDSS